MKKLFALFCAAALTMLTGCNTMAGMGKDIQRGGEKIEDAAKK